MNQQFNAPIPGQSLTTTPRNYPWERPPQITNVDEATVRHIENISKPEAIDNILYVLEAGMPIHILTESLLTIAVSKGIHSIDISLLVGPVLFKEIKSIAEEAGINYKEFFDDSDLKEKDKKAKVNTLLRKALADTPKDEQDSGYEMLQEVSSELSKPTEMKEEMEEETQEKPMGLMSRSLPDGD
tara:strand:+ start:778 stop:1332 length:555 start_codon:yes stop_codon:yes gene_type:complete